MGYSDSPILGRVMCVVLCIPLVCIIIGYSCFYQPTAITSVIWEFPDITTDLIKLCVYFGLIVLPIFVFIICLLCFLISKIKCNCSCITKVEILLSNICIRVKSNKKAKPIIMTDFNQTTHL